jgi:predicted homoserine dehydrogenase-like protein
MANSFADGTKIAMENDIFKDQAITYSDVEIPGNRLCDRLRHEQNNHFAQSKV